MNVYMLSTLAMFLASFLCLKEAWRDRDSLTFYLTSVIYGLLLEKMVVTVFEKYSYSSLFPFSFSDIPLSVGFGWSAVIYSSFMLGKRLGLSKKFLPFFSGLFVLHIDLSMDAIAIRVPFWSWEVSGIWFGVPPGNFYGWYLVAVLFTCYFLLLKDKVNNRVLLGGSVITASIVTLLPLLKLWILLAESFEYSFLVLIAILLISFLFLTRAKIHPKEFSVEILSAILVFHLFFLGVLLYYGFYRQTPLLIPLSVSMLFLGIGFHLILYFNCNHPKFFSYTSIVL